MSLLCLLFIYFVQFTDKQGSKPIVFSERAVEQRERWNIETDSLDYEVNPLYLDSIQHLGATILHTSRWMNGATIKVAYPHPLPEGKGEEEDIISKILACSFVDTVYLTRDEVSVPLAPKWERGERQRGGEADRQRGGEAEGLIGGETEQQLEVYNLNALHKQGYKGQGIVMAVIDGGFTNADTLHCFDSVRSQIIDYYDFTDDADDFFGETGPHGSMCLSTIAGLTDTYRGAATKAQYYLMRSEEYETESPKELDNLVVAMEKADSLGVNILSISLGYALFDNPNFNFTYADMNGRVSRASRAATIAARKGILVCNAMGNEGNKDWRYLTAPADADSILSVGAVGVDSTIATFSSWGPSADGRVKPEACAVGYQTVIVNPSTGLMRKGNGTSFACPLIAGLSACVWSAHPDETALQIRQRIIDSAHKKDSPDNHYGYGIPDAMKAADIPTPAGEAERRIGREADRKKVRKVLENGQIYLFVNGEKFTLMGTKKG